MQTQKTSTKQRSPEIHCLVLVLRMWKTDKCFSIHHKRQHYNIFLKNNTRTMSYLSFTHLACIYPHTSIQYILLPCSVNTEALSLSPTPSSVNEHRTIYVFMQKSIAQRCLHWMQRNDLCSARRTRTLPLSLRRPDTPRRGLQGNGKCRALLPSAESAPQRWTAAANPRLLGATAPGRQKGKQFLFLNVEIPCI